VQEGKHKLIHCKKALAVFLIMVCYVSLVLTVFVPKVEGATGYKIIEGSTSDCFFYMDGTVYSTVREGSTGYIYTYNNQLRCGQSKGGIYYTVYRTALYFETSSIPDDATITSAYLSLYVSADYASPNTNITIQKGVSSVYPHDPPEEGDYYYLNYEGNCGTRSTNDISGLGYWNITLSSTGETWIDNDGTTNFLLRHSEDIDGVAPIATDYVQFKDAEAGSNYVPILYVFYSFTGAYDYTFIGPYTDNGGVYSGVATVTLNQMYNDTTISFDLDGSGGVDTVQMNFENPLVSMIWNITSAINATRSIYFLGGYSETYQVYVPDSTDLTYLYTFNVVDLFGMTDPYLEIMITSGTTYRIIQRMPVDGVNPLPCYLVFGNLYYLQVRCDEGTLVLGTYTALTEMNQNLIVGAGSFSVDSTVLVPVVAVTRQNNTWIQANYTDGSGSTSWINVNIKYRDLQGNFVTSYSANNTASSVIVNWYQANEGLDYVVDVSSYRNGQYLTWGFQCPYDREHTNPFVDLDDLDPNYHFPIRPQYLIGTVILLLCIGFASYINVSMGAWIGFGMALFLSWLNWLPNDPVITPVILGFSGVIAGLITLAQWKNKERYI